MKREIKEKMCENCKWYKRVNLWGYEECWRNHKIYEDGYKKIYQEFVGFLEKDIEQNKNGDCPYYKEKRWWKNILNFLVRKGGGKTPKAIKELVSAKSSNRQSQN